MGYIEDNTQVAQAIDNAKDSINELIGYLEIITDDDSEGYDNLSLDYICKINAFKHKLEEKQYNLF